MGTVHSKLVPGCRVAVDGQPLDVAVAARLSRAVVSLDAELFARADLLFNDPDLSLIDGKLFAAGASVVVELGFAPKLVKIFEGELVALSPQFRRDQPPSLAIVCYDSLHRLALSQSTRALNDVDDKGVADTIAQDHGLTAEAPSGTAGHLLQNNVSDAMMLRRLSQRHGASVRIEGKKIVVGGPARREEVRIAPGDGLRKLKLRIKSGGQVASLSVHGWEEGQKRAIAATARPAQGDAAEGAREHGEGTLSEAGHAMPPADTASAEAMARGRLERVAEGYATAEFDLLGDVRVVPGATILLDGHGAGLDGKYRVDRAVHTFSKNGYWVRGAGVRTSKKSASDRAAQQAAARARKQDAGPAPTPAARRRVTFFRAPEDPALGTNPVESPVAVALDAAVLGRLHRLGQRPLASELVSVRGPGGVTSVSLRTAGGSAQVAMRPRGQGCESDKKLVFWYGDSGALGGAQWDDLQLVEVTASGDAPFATLVQASAGDAAGTLGLIDVLAEDPDAPGTFRTLRHGLFRTRTPRLRFVLPNLDLRGLSVFLDDGDDVTRDELDVSRLVRLSGPVTTVQLPGYVRLGAEVRGVTNQQAGRDRVFRRSIEAPPAEGDVSLFVFGENRVRIEQGSGPSSVTLFSAWCLHYLDAAQTVAAGDGRLEPGDSSSPHRLLASSLTLDFRDSASDADISRALQALRLKPVSYAGRYRVVEGRTLLAQTSAQIEALRQRIASANDPLITDVGRTPVAVPVRGETGVQEHLPQAISGDFNPGLHSFNVAHELHWHHFVLHTFPAHRLIESRILPQNRPDQVNVGGAHFATNSAFLRPGVEPDLARIRSLDAESASKKIAIFGHTDTVGSVEHNNALSRSRARSMEALLRHDLGFWHDRLDVTARALGPGIADRQWALHELGLYNGPLDGARNPQLDAAEAAFRAAHPGTASEAALRQGLADQLRANIGAVHEPIHGENPWGTDELRDMLRRLGFYTGAPTGPIAAALRAFQQARSLTADGAPGVATWIELVRQYQLALVPVAFAGARFHEDPGTHARAVFGCGKSFPAMPLGDNRESQQNRRVEVVFRTAPILPIDNAQVGAGVPYPDWLAPEIDVADAGAPAQTVVVALTDSGLGRGAVENWSGDASRTPNPLQIRGERLVRPTRTTGALAAPGAPIAVGNATPAVVNPDGDLRNVDDSTTGSRIGHGTAVMTCLASEGLVEIGGTRLGPAGSVLGVAPHVKIRAIQSGGPIFAMLQALEVVGSDPEVKVYSTSLLFQNVTGLTANMRRALQERTQEMLVGGRIGFAAAANYNGNAPPNGFPGIYHTSTTQFGSIAGDRRNSRSTFTGANVYQQRLAVIGASKRMGLTPHPEMGPPVMQVNDGPQSSPGQHETAAMFSYVGEQIALHTPGEQIRAFAPTGTAEATPPFFGTQNAAVVGANLTVGNTDGTSFATPMTAGIAAELMLVDPALQQTANQVRVLEYLEATADPLPNLVPTAGRMWPVGGVSQVIQRVNDPTIGGNAAHPAFSNIRRTHFWKAVLAALNGGLSSEGRTAAGGNDNFFTTCPLKDDAATTWYGFELRTLFPDAVVWLRKPGGELVEASDAGALLPNNRILASAWICTDAYDAPVGAQRFVLPAFPWLPATLTAAGRTPYFMAQLSIEKARLAAFEAIVLHLPSVDPRVSDDPPALEIRVADRVTLRSPASIPAAAPEAWKQAIRIHLDAFDDFVFHVTQKQQPLAGFRIVAPHRRTHVNLGEELELFVYAVDAQGFLTNQGPAQVTVAHNGTAGTAAQGVSFNGNPVPQAGGPVAFGAGRDPRALARLRFLGRSDETVVLTINDGTHPAAQLSLIVHQATEARGFALTLRRRGGAALDDVRPVRSGHELELEVRAVDGEGRTFAGFQGEVHLGVLQGLVGRAGPPQTGVHVKDHAADPFTTAAFTRVFTAADQGVHVFPVIDFSAGPLQLRAEAGDRSGQSQVVQVRGGGTPASFRVQASTPQTTGNAFDVVVAPIDASGNVIEDFTGIVTLSRLAGTAPVLGPPRQGVFIADTQTPADDTYDFTASDSGVHRYPVTCYTAETVRLRATAGAAHGDSAPIVVQGGAAVAPARFQVDVEGASRAGQAFNVRVTAVDAQGRRLTGFAANVQLSVVGAALAPAPTLNPASHVFAAADQGQFVFSVAPQRADSFRIQADSPGVPASQSPPIRIAAAPLDHFAVAAPATVHQNANFNVQVTAQDRFNNTVADFLGNVQVLSPAGNVLGNHSFTLADNGAFTVSIQLPSVGGGQQVSATDQNLQNASNNINVVP